MSAESTVAVTAVRAPDQRIAGLLHRDYLGFSQPASTSERWLATPTPSATVILNVGDPFGGLPPAFAAGLTDSHGSREYSARDPEGNLWSFGTYNPTLPESC